MRKSWKLIDSPGAATSNLPVVGDKPVVVGTMLNVNVPEFMPSFNLTISSKPSL